MKPELTLLTSKDDKAACSYTEKIISESRETDVWYNCFDEFASLLNHPKSLVRNRALNILAANAKWDDENKFDSILQNYLSHITDEKPITARNGMLYLDMLTNLERIGDHAENIATIR